MFSALVLSQVAAEGLTLDASSLSPSSPYQWLLSGITTQPGPTGGLSLAMDAGPAAPDAQDDLVLDFNGTVPTDAAGRWSLKVQGVVDRVGPESARYGQGAASFRAPQGSLSLQPVSSTLFSSGYPARDFSMEFWLKPVRADSGEIILMWKASRQAGKSWLSQQFTCLILRNRLNFGFLNFFADPTGKSTTVNLAGASIIVPGRWSHHLLRFDADTGLLEYLMDGKPEAVAYATSTGHEGGTVYPFISGSGGTLSIAQNYTGLMDGFRMRSAWIETPFLSRYAPSGATAISPIYDLGSTNSALERIDAVYKAELEADIHWFYRSADSSAGWKAESPEWIPFLPGAALQGAGGLSPFGRYIQFKLLFYPDASGEKSPVLNSLTVHYRADEPPAPPGGVSVSAGNGSITVRWKRSAEADVAGYMVYYGTTPGNYFGTGAAEGPSPIMVLGADSTSLKLTGLVNGTLYVITVAAFDRADPPHVGIFSRELSARPSRM
ncbi:MAG TPA: fibronectin type III domain-containing protein, partial [Spirochaetales bacterium]|nr:fibronectin type III domain-containing protein [Spirochaetales bacterium]